MIFPSFFFSSFLSIYFYPFIFLFYFFFLSSFPISLSFRTSLSSYPESTVRSPNLALSSSLSLVSRARLRRRFDLPLSCSAASAPRGVTPSLICPAPRCRCSTLQSVHAIQLRLHACTCYHSHRAAATSHHR